MKQNIAALIVEDNMDDYLILQEAFAASELFDATLSHQEDLQGAVSAAQHEPFDVVILDLSLPDSFGLDTFISFYEKFPMLPIVIMTGTKDQEMAFEAVRQGAQDFLFKNELSSKATLRSIRYAIDRQRLTTELRMALNHVKELQGMLPICSICKSVRDDQGYWNQVEEYLSKHLEVNFTHSLCPSCVTKHYSEYFSDK